MTGSQLTWPSTRKSKGRRDTVRASASYQGSIGAAGALALRARLLTTTLAGRKGRGHWAFYLATPLLSVALTLLIAEFGLALFYPVPFSVEHNMYYEADRHVG